MARGVQLEFWYGESSDFAWAFCGYRAGNTNTATIEGSAVFVDCAVLHSDGRLREK